MKTSAFQVILVSTLFLSISSATAQPVKFKRLLPGPVDEFLSSIVETENGYMICGGTMNNGLRSILLIRTDQYGNVLWRKYINKNNHNCFEGAANAMVRTADGGYAIAGTLINPDSGMRSAWLVKLDAEGDTMWTRKYRTDTVYIGAYQCKQTSDNGYALVGATDTTGNNVDMLMVKTDSLGEMEWYSTYGGNKTDAGFKIIHSFDNGYVLCGFTLSYGSGSSPQDWYIVKTDSAGNQQWYKTFGSPTEEDGGARGVTMLHDSCFVFTGAYSLGYDGDSYFKAKIVKTNSGGTVIWDKEYEGTWGVDPYPENVYLYFYSVIEQDDGSLLSTAIAKDYYGWLDTRLFKFGSQGDTIWTRHYRAVDTTVVPMAEYLFVLHNTSDGGVIMAGMGESDWLMSPHNQIWIVKTDCNGFESPPVAGFSVTVDENNVTLALHSEFADSCIVNLGDGTEIHCAADSTPLFHSYQDTGTYTILLTAYSSCDMADADTAEQQVIITSVGADHLHRNLLNPKIFPNPANGKIHIYLPPDKQDVRIDVFTPDGKILFSEKLHSPHSTLDLIGIDDGICFLRFTFSEGVVSKKIVKISSLL